MPISYSVAPVHKIVLVTATGICGREDMDTLRARLLTDDRIVPGMRMLLEATEVESLFTFTDLQEIAARLEGLFSKGINRVAVVADSRFIYSIAKTFRVFADNQPVQVCAFRKLEEAEGWLHDGVVNPEVMELAETSPPSLVDRDAELTSSRKAS